MVSKKLINNFVNALLKEAENTVVEINESKLLQGGFASFEPGDKKIHPEIDPNNEELHTALKDAGLHCAVTKDNIIIVFGPRCNVPLKDAVIKY